MNEFPPEIENKQHNSMAIFLKKISMHTSTQLGLRAVLADGLWVCHRHRQADRVAGHARGLLGIVNALLVARVVPGGEEGNK
jgi:hypothetical protein